MKSIAYISIVVLLEIILGIAPKADRLTWALENFPVWIGVVWIALTCKQFSLTHLCLGLLTVHAAVLAIGGHYTYSQVPIGFRMQEWFGFSRNHYDRIGHLMQGFAPAILLRELLVRRAQMPKTWWLPFVVILACLGFSALYELIEWWTAEIAGAASHDFLGAQGDVWDAQWDMFLAGIGATTSLLFLSRLHDRHISRENEQCVRG